MPTAEELLKVAGSLDHPSRKKVLPRYSPTIGDRLTLAARKLFEECSNIPPSEVESHICKIRDLAWDVFPWACIGEFCSKDATQTSENLPKFLDIGTCIGQDLRALHNDGVPLSVLYGTDPIPQFETIGHALFKDEDRFLPDHYIVGDIFNLSPSLAKTAGSWSAVNMIMFLHLFNIPNAEQVCANALKLLRPKAGSLITGAQTGTTQPGKLVLKPPMCEPGEYKTIYRHSAETLVELWQRVSEKLNIRVKATAEYDEEEIKEREHGVRDNPDWEKSNRSFVGNSERRIYFMVELL